MLRVYSICSFSFLFVNSSYLYFKCFHTVLTPLTSCLNIEGSPVSKRNVSSGVKEDVLLYFVFWFDFKICSTDTPCNSFAFLPMSPSLIIFEAVHFTPSVYIHHGFCHSGVTQVLNWAHYPVFYSRTMCVMGISIYHEDHLQAGIKYININKSCITEAFALRQLTKCHSLSLILLRQYKSRF